MSKDFTPDIQARMSRIMPMIKQSFEPSSQFNKWRMDNPELPEVQLINSIAESLNARLASKLGRIGGQRWAAEEYFRNYGVEIAEFCIAHLAMLETCNTAFEQYKAGQVPSSSALHDLRKEMEKAQMVEISISEINHICMSFYFIESMQRKMEGNNYENIQECESYQKNVKDIMLSIEKVQVKYDSLKSESDFIESYLFLAEMLNNNSEIIEKARIKIDELHPSCMKDLLSSKIISRAKEDVELLKPSSHKPKI